MKGLLSCIARSDRTLCRCLGFTYRLVVLAPNLDKDVSDSEIVRLARHLNIESSRLVVVRGESVSTIAGKLRESLRPLMVTS